MSVYCSFGHFDDELGEDPEHQPPLIYQKSHVIPRHNDPRGGCLDLGSIPAFLGRNGEYDEAEEAGNRCWPYLRVSLISPVPGEDTVVLTHRQVIALRADLDDWLARVKPDLDPEAQDQSGLSDQGRGSGTHSG